MKTSDSVALSLLPEGKSVDDAVLALWIHMYDLPDQAHMTRRQLAKKMANDMNTTLSAVVRCACAFYAGKLAK